MTKKELVELGKEHGITARISWLKDRLIQTILDGMRSAGEAVEPAGEVPRRGRSELVEEVASRPGRGDDGALEPSAETVVSEPGPEADGHAGGRVTVESPPAPALREESPGSRDEAQGVRHHPALPDSPALPVDYGRDLLRLLVVRPGRLFAFWEITPDCWEAGFARAGSPENYQTVLRLIRVEGNGSDEAVLGDEILVPFARSWYLVSPSGPASFVVVFGLLLGDGVFQPLLRSNRVTMPSEGISDEVDEAYVTLGDEYDRFFELSGGAGFTDGNFPFGGWTSRLEPIRGSRGTRSRRSGRDFGPDSRSGADPAATVDPRAHDDGSEVQ